MARYEDPRFRITVPGVGGLGSMPLGTLTTWPAQPVDAPLVRRVGQPELVDGEWLVYPVPSPDPMHTEWTALPTDFYLHEVVDTDETDSESLRRIAGHGEWVRREPIYGAEYSDLADDHREWEHIWRIHMNSGRRAGRESLSVQQLAKLGGKLAERHPLARVNHVDEIGIRVRHLKEAVRVISSIEEPNPLTDVDWFNLVHSSMRGLSPFQVRIFLERSEDREGSVLTGAPDPTVYSLCWLQLFNDLRSEVQMSRCANETCGRHFVRQRGRSAYGQHRTVGVTYCSNTCARAQAQREYRRRAKQRNER